MRFCDARSNSVVSKIEFYQIWFFFDSLLLRCSCARAVNCVVITWLTEGKNSIWIGRIADWIAQCSQQEKCSLQFTVSCFIYGCSDFSINAIALLIINKDYNYWLKINGKKKKNINSSRNAISLKTTYLRYTWTS
jgi:hypothetical protein